ncbi:tRNA (adenosine(37)-N6)-threonylcarbamoyltransferase complex ATPase subunit type 1 TsaE [Nafulsella turpanensis]|uniref:tRNA (adenosine(37)-N6)-threonylcarbamoyltransferase complex ATPase subunit type 1 TsaE n=1 Tax=Nafulsella turpanensis TaxID=1265690 RepID=UPI000366F235|nr:tRNA (adenosine(37)-N6)-threonylcarbamoyltransferase complex ATPase subunit type 1 TsaE [Nafulsella turpanensis]
MLLEKGLEISCPSQRDLPETAAAIIAFARGQGGQKIWLFEGSMGAGKTTLIKEICLRLGVEDTVQSPTFSIVNEYRAEGDEPVYHFDFYRIKEVAEALQIGAEEYFYSGHYCLIEWPSKIEEILPEQYLQVQIEVNEDNSRTILLSTHE